MHATCSWVSMVSAAFFESTQKSLDGRRFSYMSHVWDTIVCLPAAWLHTAHVCYHVTRVNLQNVSLRLYIILCMLPFVNVARALGWLPSWLRMLPSWLQPPVRPRSKQRSNGGVLFVVSFRRHKTKASTHTHTLSLCA